MTLYTDTISSSMRSISGMKRRYFVVALAALSVMAVGRATAGEAASESSPQPAYLAGEIVDGAVDAPVTVIEYASMTCPSCAQFHLTVLPEFKEKYVDTGKVRMIFREFPLDGLALRASMLARCGGEAQVHGYLNVLFAQQHGWATSQDPLASLARIARMGGMSGETFETCMADQDLMKQVVQSRQDGSEKHDVTSTPSFIIDGKTYSGGLSIAEFDKILEPLLPDAPT